MATPSMRTTLIAAVGGGLAALSLAFAGPVVGTPFRGGRAGDTDSTSQSDSQSDPRQEEAFYNYIRSGTYGIAPPPGITFGTGTGTDDPATVQSPDPADPGDLGWLE